MKNLKFLSLLITAKQNCSRYIRHYVDSGEKLTIMTKDQKQLYTNVDLVAQAIFEKTIKREYPQINIIGEENLHELSAKYLIEKEKKLISHYSKNEKFKLKLEENLESLFNGTKRIISQNDEDNKKGPFDNFEKYIKNRKVKILLDPLDATYSFVNKNYNEATILAGVLVNNKPYLGSITSPFYSFLEKDNAMMTYFNIPNHGIFSLKTEKSQFFDNVENFQIDQVRVSKKSNPAFDNPNELKLIVSRTREEKLKQILQPLVSTNVIKNLLIKTDNGMGFRSIKMIEQGYYFMTIKSCLGFWDLCATDAIFRELGGGVLSLQGDQIDYSKAGSKEVFPYDIMIGDDNCNLKFYLQNYKLHCNKI